MYTLLQIALQVHAHRMLGAPLRVWEPYACAKAGFARCWQGAGDTSMYECLFVYGNVCMHACKGAVDTSTSSCVCVWLHVYYRNSLACVCLVAHSWHKCVRHMFMRMHIRMYVKVKCTLCSSSFSGICARANVHMGVCVHTHTYVTCTQQRRIVTFRANDIFELLQRCAWPVRLHECVPCVKIHPHSH